jgi:hypothetical protein
MTRLVPHGRCQVYFLPPIHHLTIYELTLYATRNLRHSSSYAPWWRWLLNRLFR